MPSRAMLDLPLAAVGVLLGEERHQLVVRLDEALELLLRGLAALGHLDEDGLGRILLREREGDAGHGVLDACWSRW